MSPSFLSRRIKRTSDLLKVGASGQVWEYEEWFQSLRGLYDRLLSDFIVSEFSYQGAFDAALRLFGSGKVRFAGVEGTMYSRPLFDLMIFFGVRMRLLVQLSLGRMRSLWWSMIRSFWKEVREFLALSRFTLMRCLTLTRPSLIWKSRASFRFPSL